MKSRPPIPFAVSGPAAGQTMAKRFAVTGRFTGTPGPVSVDLLNSSGNSVLGIPQAAFYDSNGNWATVIDYNQTLSGGSIRITSPDPNSPETITNISVNPSLNLEVSHPTNPNPHFANWGAVACDGIYSTPANLIVTVTNYGVAVSGVSVSVSAGSGNTWTGALSLPSPAPGNADKLLFEVKATNGSGTVIGVCSSVFWTIP